MNHAPAAAGKNTRTAAGEWPKDISKAAEHRALQDASDRHVLEITARFGVR